MILAILLAVVNSVATPVSYGCDGVTAAFSVPWAYLSQSDLVVTSTTAGGTITTLSISTDFTLSVTSTQTSATLTITAPASSCPSGSTLKIRRNTQPTQPTALNQQTQFLPSTVMQMVDRAVMAVQDQISGVSYNLTGTAFANQGTTTTVLHGNASGNPSFSAVALGSDVSGTLPQARGGTGAGALTCSGATPLLTSNGSAQSCSGFTLTAGNGASGTLPQANGGTGVGSTTCSAGQVLTSDGTSYSCTQSSVDPVASGNTGQILNGLSFLVNSNNSTAATNWGSQLNTSLPAGSGSLKTKPFNFGPAGSKLWFANFQGTLSSQVAGVVAASANLFVIEQGMVLTAVWTTPDGVTVNSHRYGVGWSSSNPQGGVVVYPPATGPSAVTSNLREALFMADGTKTNWWFCTADIANQSCVDTGIPLAATDSLSGTIDMSAVTSIKWSLSNQSTTASGTKSTNLPPTNATPLYFMAPYVVAFATTNITFNIGVNRVFWYSY